MCTCGFIAVFHTHVVMLWFTNSDILAFYFNFCFWDDLEKIKDKIHAKQLCVIPPKELLREKSSHIKNDDSVLGEPVLCD